MTALLVLAGLALAGVTAWLVANAAWLVAKWLVRASHTDALVEQFFDTDGALSEADYLKFKEQHPHGGRG